MPATLVPERLGQAARPRELGRDLEVDVRGDDHELGHDEEQQEQEGPQGLRQEAAVRDLVARFEDRQEEEEHPDGEGPHEGHVGLSLARDHVELRAGRDDHRHQRPRAPRSRDPANREVAQDRHQEGQQGHGEAEGKLRVAEEPDGGHLPPEDEDRLAQEGPRLRGRRADRAPLVAPFGRDPVVGLEHVARDLPIVGLPRVPQAKGAQAREEDRPGEEDHEGVQDPSARCLAERSLDELVVADRQRPGLLIGGRGLEMDQDRIVL